MTETQWSANLPEGHQVFQLASGVGGNWIVTLEDGSQVPLASLHLVQCAVGLPLIVRYLPFRFWQRRVKMAAVTRIELRHL